MGLFDRNNNNFGAALGAQINRQNVRFGPPNMQKPMSTTNPLSQPGGEIEAARRSTGRAIRGEQTIQNAGRLGTLWSGIGGIGGAAAGTALLTPFLGPFAPVVGGGLGAMLGGVGGQWAGGVRPDLGDAVGYGVSGALSGGAGAALGSAFGGVATTPINSAIQTAAGRGVQGGLGSAFDINTQYDPRYRYFYNTGQDEIQSAFSLTGDQPRRYA